MGESTAPTAFVPGHVTAFFGVHRAGDPYRTGSTGAGIVLEDGVEVTVDPGEPLSVTVNADAVEPGPVTAVLETLGVEGGVRARTRLPPGAGFGVSGALALGTALSANAVADEPRSSNELIRIAHRAEVEAGTGLGDVVAQARGGVPVRLEPGAPPHGVLDGVPATARVEYLSFGQLATAEVITGDTATLTDAGERALDRLQGRPTLPALFQAARAFAAEADLVTPRVAEAVDDVTAAGGEACMAMLGETVVALDSGLSDAGYDPSSCRIHPGGAAPGRFSSFQRER